MDYSTLHYLYAEDVHSGAIFLLSMATSEKSTRTTKPSKRSGRFTRTKMDSKDFRKKKVSGCFPEHGAIFMSDRNTLQECFGRSLFGLPDNFSSFVKNVKAGMTLFLFQFEDRKLYGVFKAISDGGMNIVPRAYASSGKQFPAQVKFTSILRCDPLFENEFSDVIRDNYFTPKKFHFGLSKDQVQNLMRLFNSRKRQVPRSLHQKKRKNRKWDFQVIADELMKGRVTNTWKRKLNTPGTSVTAEQKSEELILTPESCGKFESIHFDDDDAYNPENPGFNYSVGSGAQSAASCESHELPTLQKKKGESNILEEETGAHSAASYESHELPALQMKKGDSDILEEETGAHSAASYESHALPTLQKKKGDSDILEEETEDFIPLGLTDNSDLEDGEIDNSLEENQMDLDMIVGNYVSSIPIPRFLLSNEEYKKIDDSSSVAVSDLQSKDESGNLNSLLSKGLYSDEPKTQTSVSSIPIPRFLLSNEEYKKIDDFSSVAVSDLQSKDESGNLNSLLSKGLYSDEPKTQTSVFSRLSFSPKGIASKNQRKKITQQSDGTKYKKRASVFMRLTGASDDVAPQIHFMAGLNEGTSGYMKGK